MKGLARTLRNGMPQGVLLRGRRVRSTATLLVEFYREARRHARIAGPDDAGFAPTLSGTNFEAQLTKDYHRVEKGLSLRSPRRPFGRDVEARLQVMLDSGNAAAVEDLEKYASSARDALVGWNESGEVDPTISPSLGGVFIDGDRAMPEARDLKRFFGSRRSVRDFDGGRTVHESTLRTATAMAVNAPSVCNRQAGRVSFWSGADVSRILAHQNGNAGFRESVPNLAVVSVERGLFLGPHERNQPWIDGALFGMTLTWALHGLGVSTCLLNWSMSTRASELLRREAGIPETEDIVFLIAMGFPGSGDETRIARSPRRRVDEVARFPCAE